MTPLERDQPATVHAITHLRDCGFRPNFIIDVGAYHGEWSMLAARIYPGVPLLMIEANPDKRNMLRTVTRAMGPHAHSVSALLGEKQSDSTVPFYLCEGGSSVYRELTSFPKREIHLPVTTLDDEIEEDVPLLMPWLMKLDVQGAELDVLRGGHKTLERCEVVMMELSTLPYDAGAPLFADSIKFMDERGFAAYDICGAWRRQTDGTMFQCDVVFARYESKLREYKKFWINEPEEVTA